MNKDIDTDGYTFITSHGKMKIKPCEILQALEEQSKADESADISEEDLRGWAVINATDENGKSRPLLLMRVLPSPNHNIPNYVIAKDDNNMSNIIMRKVYKLTPLKIKWIKFSAKVKKILRIK